MLSLYDIAELDVPLVTKQCSHVRNYGILSGLIHFIFFV